MSRLFRRFRAWLSRALEAILPLGRTGLPPRPPAPLPAASAQQALPDDDAVTEPMERMPEIDIDVTVFDAVPSPLLNVPNPAFRPRPLLSDFEEVTRPGGDREGTRVGGWMPQRPVTPGPRRVAGAQG